MKKMKRFLGLLLSLTLVLGLFPGMSLTAYAADTTVTWNASDIVTEHPWDDSFTKDGITITAANINFIKLKFQGGGTFTTTSGKFTKIVVTASNNVSGTGWSGNGSEKNWTGDASPSVSFGGNFMARDSFRMVFTIEE